MTTNMTTTDSIDCYMSDSCCDIYCTGCGRPSCECECSRGACKVCAKGYNSCGEPDCECRLLSTRQEALDADDVGPGVAPRG